MKTLQLTDDMLIFPDYCSISYTIICFFSSHNIGRLYECLISRSEYFCKVERTSLNSGHLSHIGIYRICRVINNTFPFVFQKNIAMCFAIILVFSDISSDHFSSNVFRSDSNLVEVSLA